MKCPIRKEELVTFTDGTEQLSHHCLQEECAWWDDGEPSCAVLTIARELALKRQQEEVNR